MSDTEPVRPPPQRGGGVFYGWWVAAVATLAFAGSGPGQTLIVSELNAPLSTALGLEDADRDLSIAYLIATVASGLLLARIGKSIDRLGSRIGTAVAAVAVALACCVLASAQNLVWVLVGFFAVRAAGQGAIALAAQHSVAMWFDKKLGVVNGYKLVATNLIWAGVPLLYLWLSDSIGWRLGYVALGIGVAVVVAPLALLIIRDKPEDLGLCVDGEPPSSLTSTRNTAMAIGTDESSDTERQPVWGFTLKQAEATGAFWILVLASVAFSSIGTAALFHMQSYLAERSIGVAFGAAKITSLTADAAALESARPIAAQAKSVWVLTMMAFALPAGLLADRIAARTMLACGLAALGGTSVLMLLASSPWMVYAAMMAMGVSHSLASAAGSTAPARFFGRASHGAIRGSIGRMTIIGTAVGPALFVAPRGLTDNFDAALIISAAVCVPIALVTLRMRTPTLPA